MQFDGELNCVRECFVWYNMKLLPIDVDYIVWLETLHYTCATFRWHTDKNVSRFDKIPNGPNGFFGGPGGRKIFGKM